MLEMGAFGAQGIVVLAVSRCQSDVVIQDQPGTIGLVGLEVGTDLHE